MRVSGRPQAWFLPKKILGAYERFGLQFTPSTCVLVETPVISATCVGDIICSTQSVTGTDNTILCRRLQQKRGKQEAGCDL